MGTRGAYLNQVLQKVNTPFYQGIFAANTVPEAILNMPIFCIIINTDLNHMEGSHWITLIKYKGQTKIFDSLQLPNKTLFPQLRHVFKTLRATRIRRKSIQPILSDTCGFYCLHEILKFHLLIHPKAATMKNKIKPFSTPDKNDNICIENISKMISFLSRK